MPSYQIKISKKAFKDIRKASAWYNEQLPGLGERFQKQVSGQNFELKETS